jgi:transcriptional regulator GlxA family with amidase domain
MGKDHEIFMLAFAGCQILDVAGPLQMFAGANLELGRPAYRLTVAAAEAGPFETSSGLRLVADIAFSALTSRVWSTTDTVIVAGGEGGTAAVAGVAELVALVRAASLTDARIVSICAGAFFLAAAGVLDGRKAATHWRAVEKLRAFRPAVTVDPEALFVRDGNVWTSAGVTAGMDLALAVIDADFGSETALAVARRHVVFRTRPGGQGQFALGVTAREPVRDKRISQAMDAVIANPRADWRAEAMADKAGLSARSLSRLFQGELGTSPAEFVDGVRVEAARRALLETAATVDSIARDCGFGSRRQMDRAFGRAISATPSEYRARFNPPEETVEPARAVAGG